MNTHRKISRPDLYKLTAHAKQRITERFCLEGQQAMEWMRHIMKDAEFKGYAADKKRQVWVINKVTLILDASNYRVVTVYHDNEYPKYAVTQITEQAKPIPYEASSVDTPKTEPTKAVKKPVPVKPTPVVDQLDDVQDQDVVDVVDNALDSYYRMQLRKHSGTTAPLYARLATLSQQVHNTQSAKILQRKNAEINIVMQQLSRYEKTYQAILQSIEDMRPNKEQRAKSQVKSA